MLLDLIDQVIRRRLFNSATASPLPPISGSPTSLFFSHVGEILSDVPEPSHFDCDRQMGDVLRTPHVYPWGGGVSGTFDEGVSGIGC